MGIFLFDMCIIGKGGTMKRACLILMILALIGISQAQEDIVTNYLDKIKVGDAFEYKNLKIFPIHAIKTLSTQSYVTLDEATDKGWIKIKEVGSGQVNFVTIKNTGNKMVFLLTGEVISGAKQDRMLSTDVLLPANSSWTQVPVFCVEHGRWTQISPEFKSEKMLVPNAVRQKAKVSESQSEVWDEIATSQDRLGVASGTGTITANYEDKDVQTKIDEYEKEFKKFPELSPTTIGVVVTTGDRVICFDMFANIALLKKYWKKLIRSYTMDALYGEKSCLDQDDIERFLEALSEANFTSTNASGIGTFLKVESDFGKGSALVYGSAVVHMDFFPSEGFIDDPELHLDIRRDLRLEE
jgi:hypothetical protein